MPELAEVELARRQWQIALGQSITRIETHPKTGIFRKFPAAALQILDRAKLSDSRAHGKRLFFTFQKNNALLNLELHLGMSGRLSAAGPDYQAEKHDHLVFFTSQNSLIFNDYRTFGRVLLSENPEPWSHLPPEPHDKNFTLAHLQKICVRHPKKPLKALILDQSAFPGIGNWMADEICWKMGRHPATPVLEVEPAALRKATRFVTLGALRHIAEKNPILNTHGFAPGGYVAQVPPKNWLFQHRWKKGGHCPKCHSLLARDTIATRTTAWCPICQK